MITPVVMPQMGLEVTEGSVIAVRVEVGQSVDLDDVLVEIETDKALADVVAPRDGVVAEISVAPGDAVPVGAVLLVLSDGESLETSSHGRNGSGRQRVAPVARRAASRLGVTLETVTGTGPRGRITLADVERASAIVVRAGSAESAAPERTVPAPQSVGAAPQSVGEPRVATTDGFAELIPLTGIRRTIARRMTESQTIPQFSLNREVDATWLLATKAEFPQPAPGSVRPGLNDMLAQVLGELILRHPPLATAYIADLEGEPCIGRRADVDVGLAVATDRGLMVPVLRAAHERSLAQLAGERVRLVGAARSGRLRSEDMRDASVTISNLGSFGIDSFVAMLNPGEAAILAVGRVLDRVRPVGRGIAVVPTLSLSLTIDHRVIDGAAGAQALAELCALLEGEMSWRM